MKRNHLEMPVKLANRLSEDSLVLPKYKALVHEMGIALEHCVDELEAPGGSKRIAIEMALAAIAKWKEM